MLWSLRLALRAFSGGGLGPAGARHGALGLRTPALRAALLRRTRAPGSRAVGPESDDGREGMEGTGSKV